MRQPPRFYHALNGASRMNGTIYDAIMAFAERRLLSELRRGLLAPLAGEIVEIGAGTGANFRYYAPQAHVIAFEPDVSMANRAFHRATESSACIEVRIANDTALREIPSKSLDAVVFPLVLCSIDDPRCTLTEARRVLKGSGTIAVLEHVRSPGTLGRIQDVLTPAWQRVFGGCQPNRSTKDLLEEAGFDTERLVSQRISRVFLIQELLVGHAFAHAGEVLHAQVSAV